jgi:hypothetical protein
MDDPEFLIWLLFLLIFAILPIKPLFEFIFKGFGGIRQPNTYLRTEEDSDQEKCYSQLYRPGDKKYDKIAKLSNNAKSIN